MPLIQSTTPLTHFKLISFDVFGTLIDWESGISDALFSSAHINSLPSTHPLKAKEPLLAAYEAEEKKIQTAQPGLRYSDLLAAVYKLLIQSHCPETLVNEKERLEDAAKKFAASIADWLPFPDTLAALHVLAKHYKLVPVSNVDNDSFALTIRNGFQGFPFSAVYTAQDIGSYKPDLNNFEYLIRHAKNEFGVQKGEILHVAQSRFHDHVPAAKIGLQNVWVDREGGVMGRVSGDEVEGARWGWEVKTLGELAVLVGEAFRE